MNLILSSICRAILPPAVLALVKEAGIMPIPSDLMDPRQIKVIPYMGEDFPARVKFHRGQLITTITSVTADELVDQRKAEYLPQSLLVYSREDYLADTGISNEERDRVTASDADLVVVAVIGDNRSPLAVVRNMAEASIKSPSGFDPEDSYDTEADEYDDARHYCRVLLQMKEQAADALEAANVILIED